MLPYAMRIGLMPVKNIIFSVSYLVAKILPWACNTEEDFR